MSDVDFNNVEEVVRKTLEAVISQVENDRAHNIDYDQQRGGMALEQYQRYLVHRLSKARISLREEVTLSIRLGDDGT